jgi:drug/metabolite transporter (DMT)-like permease
MTFNRLNTATETRSHFIGILYVLAAVVIWSTVPIGTRLLMRNGSVFSAAFISAARLMVAGAIFIGIRALSCRKTGEPIYVPIRRRGWLLIAAASVIVNSILYAIGLRYTTAGPTSIISQVNSVATVLLAAVLLGERLTLQKISGMLIASAGVLLVVFQGSSLHDLLSSSHFVGNLIEVLAALAWPFYAIGQTKLMQAQNSRQILMPIFVVAAVLSLVLLPCTGPLIVHTPTLGDWGILFFLGAGSTAAAYWLFAAGLQRIETSEGTMFNVLMPPIALLLAHWLLQEPLHANVLTGLALVVSGLVLLVWRRTHSPLRPRPARGDASAAISGFSPGIPRGERSPSPEKRS